jgi:hypothetical protein
LPELRPEINGDSRMRENDVGNVGRLLPHAPSHSRGSGKLRWLGAPPHPPGTVIPAKVVNPSLALVAAIVRVAAPSTA